MSTHSPSKPIRQIHINIARTEANKLRDEDFDAIKYEGREAIERVMTAVSSCTDVDALIGEAYKQFGIINREFLQQGSGIAAKERAIAMMKAYTTSIYSQLGVIRKSPPSL